MISDHAIANLVLGLYAYAGASPVAWDFYDPGEGSDVCHSVKIIDGTAHWGLRGSITRRDWWHDAEAWASVMDHWSLGPVQHGFAVGMDKAFLQVKDMLMNASAVVVYGHSLGAARGCIGTGQLVIAGKCPVRRVGFGEPRPGMQRLADIIRNVPACSYRNVGDAGHDFVTDVPFSTPDLPYVHPTPLTDVHGPLDAVTIRSLGLFAFHHMPSYAAALKG